MLTHHFVMLSKPGHPHDLYRKGTKKTYCTSAHTPSGMPDM